jgi:hypothetical protein
MVLMQVNGACPSGLDNLQDVCCNAFSRGLKKIEIETSE